MFNKMFNKYFTPKMDLEKSQEYSPLANEADTIRSSVEESDTNDETGEMLHHRPLSRKAQGRHISLCALWYTGLLVTVSFFMFYLGWKLSPKSVHHAEIDTAWRMFSLPPSLFLSLTHF